MYVCMYVCVCVCVCVLVREGGGYSADIYGLCGNKIPKYFGPKTQSIHPAVLKLVLPSARRTPKCWRDGLGTEGREIGQPGR